MKDYFSHYKFMGDYLLRQVFQDEVISYLKVYLKQGFTLVPVPLSPERMAERGFNQVIGLIGSLPYSQPFQKIDIAKQSAQDRKGRISSCNPFSLNGNQELPNKILLIDDIYTTGATLHHLVTLLQKSGVTEIESFSLAR
ncbi:ComF family protein [Streptococcus dentiloxodontae]